jgi:TRAP-type C4-dicarboxylate transport system permease small subunit
MVSEDVKAMVNIALFYLCMIVILFITLGCAMVIKDGSDLSVDPLTRKTYPPVAHRLP